MKSKTLFLGTALLSAMVSLLLAGCGGSEQQNKDTKVELASEHEHHDEMAATDDHKADDHEHAANMAANMADTGDDHEAGEHEHADAADDHGAGEHSHDDGGGHMQHMVDVKNWLKGELKDLYDQPVPPASEVQLAQGKKIYATICFACHGAGGKGDGPASLVLEQKPADFTDNAHSKYYSDQGRLHILKKGVAGTAMIGWESALSEEEILSVFGYITSLRSPEVAGEHDPGDGKYACPMHPEITSDEPGKCSKCGMNLELKEEEHEHGDHAH